MTEWRPAYSTVLLLLLSILLAICLPVISDHSVGIEAELRDAYASLNLSQTPNSGRNITGTYRGKWSSASGVGALMPRLVNMPHGSIVYRLYTQPSSVGSAVQVVKGELVIQNNFGIMDAELSMAIEGFYVPASGRIHALLQAQNIGKLLTLPLRLGSPPAKLSQPDPEHPSDKNEEAARASMGLHRRLGHGAMTSRWRSYATAWGQDGYRGALRQAAMDFLSGQLRLTREGRDQIRTLPGARLDHRMTGGVGTEDSHHNIFPMDKSIVDYLALYDSCQLRLELKVKHVLEPSAHSKKVKHVPEPSAYPKQVEHVPEPSAYSKHVKHVPEPSAYSKKSKGRGRSSNIVGGSGDGRGGAGGGGGTSDPAGAGGAGSGGDVSVGAGGAGDGAGAASATGGAAAGSSSIVAGAANAGGVGASDVGDVDESLHSSQTSQRLVEQKDGVSVHVVEDVGHIVQRNGRHVNSLGVQSDSQGVQSDSKGVQNDSQGVKSDSQQGRRPTSDVNQDSVDGSHAIRQMEVLWLRDAPIRVRGGSSAASNQMEVIGERDAQIGLGGESSAASRQMKVIGERDAQIGLGGESSAASRQMKVMGLRDVRIGSIHQVVVELVAEGRRLAGDVNHAGQASDSEALQINQHSQQGVVEEGVDREGGAGSEGEGQQHGHDKQMKHETGEAAGGAGSGGSSIVVGGAGAGVGGAGAGGSSIVVGAASPGGSDETAEELEMELPLGQHNYLGLGDLLDLGGLVEGGGGSDGGANGRDVINLRGTGGGGASLEASRGTGAGGGLDVELHLLSLAELAELEGGDGGGKAADMSGAGGFGVNKSETAATLGEDDEYQVILEGGLFSPNCNISMNVNGYSVQLFKYYRKAIRYCFIQCCLALVQIFLSIRIAVAITTSQAVAKKASLYTLGHMAVLDAYLCILHLTAGLVMNKLFLAMACVCCLEFFLFAVLGMRWCLFVWRAQRENSRDSWGNTQREIAYPSVCTYTSFYGMLLAGLVIVYVLQEHVMILCLAAHSFWLPQIVHSARLDTKPVFTTQYVVGMSTTRLFLPLYLFACPNNVLKIEVDPWLCVCLVAWMALQAGLLVVQQSMGARRFIPSRWLPQKYSYHRKATLRECGMPNTGDEYLRYLPSRVRNFMPQAEAPENVDIESGMGSAECVICMSPVVIFPANSRMLTPCGHFFHTPCLKRWMNIKMDCPTCRSRLPAP